MGGPLISHEINVKWKKFQYYGIAFLACLHRRKSMEVFNGKAVIDKATGLTLTDLPRYNS